MPSVSRRGRPPALLVAALALVAAVATVTATPVPSAAAATSGTSRQQLSGAPLTGLPVTGDSGGWMQVVTGDRHSCGLTVGGQVWCWGANDRGQLGRDDVDQSADPVLVEQVSGISALAAGGGHTCATGVGGAWCWGANGSGQLGDGTTRDRSTPVRSLASGVGRVSAGRTHTCAVAPAGSNEVQQLRIVASSGTFTLSLGALTSPALRWDIDAAGLDKAVDGLSGNWDADVRAGARSGTFVLDLDRGSLAGQDVDGFTVDDTGLRGTGAGAEVETLVDGGWRLLCWGSDASGQLGRGPITDADLEPDGLAADPGSDDLFVADRDGRRVWRFGQDGSYRDLFRSLGYQPGAIGTATLDGRAKLYVVNDSGDSADFGVLRRYDVDGGSADAVYDPRLDRQVVPASWTCRCFIRAMAVDPADGTVALVVDGEAGPTSTGALAPFSKLIRVAPDLSAASGAPVDLAADFPRIEQLTDLSTGTDADGRRVLYALERPADEGRWRIGIWDLDGPRLALRAGFWVSPADRGPTDGSFDGACPGLQHTPPRQQDQQWWRTERTGVYDFGRLGPAGDGNVGVVTRYGYVPQEQRFENEEGDPADPAQDDGIWVDQGDPGAPVPLDGCVNVFRAGSQGGYGRFVAGLRGSDQAGTSLPGEPTDVTATRDGRVLVALADQERIQQFDGEGEALIQWPELQYSAVPVGSRALSSNLTDLAVSVSAVSAGDDHTCVATTDDQGAGPVLCWGSDAAGQLGVEEETRRWIPHRDPDQTDGRVGFPVVPSDPEQDGAQITAGLVSAGGGHTCTSDAGAGHSGTRTLCWGDDDLGQLGGASSPTAPVVRTPRMHDVVVSGGTGTCLAITDGSLECWGPDVLNVQALGGPVASLDVGGRHACALVEDTLRCWGDDRWGQTGPDGTGDAVAHPVTAEPRVRTIAPAGLGDPIVVVFDDATTAVTQDSFELLDADGHRLDLTVACQDAAAVATSCRQGRVRTVLLRPDDGIVAAERYRLTVAPDGDLVAGDRPVSPAPFEVDGPTRLSEHQLGPGYRWATARVGDALGRTVLREEARGATATYAFRGRRITWHTLRGPGEGVATVLIDGRARRQVDNSAVRSGRAAVSFNRLGPGAHTITLVAEGRRGVRGQGQSVSIDAFAVGARLDRTPHLDAGWGRARIGSARVARAATAGSSVMLEFRGSQVVWRTVTGPHQGRATVRLDGVVVQRIDTWSERVGTQSIVVPAGPGRHRLTVRVDGAGQGHRHFVAIDGFEVTP